MTFASAPDGRPVEDAQAIGPLALIGLVWRARRDMLALFPEPLRRGPWTSVRLGAARLITVNDPHLARHVLADAADAYGKGALYHALLGDVLGRGSLLLEGAASRARRRLLAPAFNARAMERVGRIVDARADALLAGWLAASGPVDATRDLAQMTMSVALEAFFGADLGPDLPAVAELLDRVIVDASSPSFADLLSLPAWAPRRSRARLRADVARVDALLYRLIDGRAGRERAADPDILDLLMTGVDPETGEGLSRADIRDEVMTLLMAGHETTALTLSWGLDLLARRPWPPADPAAVGPVLDEVLRLRPPAYALARMARAHDRWGELRIAPGDSLQFPVVHMQRDPRWWDDPETFDPDRFRRPLREPAAYMPFGAGPRRCIGMALGRLEGRAVLAAALTRLRLSPAGPEPAPLGRVTLRAKTPIRLHVAARDASA